MDHLPEKVVVHCEDNTTFEGDLVVGADGVRSTIRYQMWDYMETRGLINEIAEERTRMRPPFWDWKPVLIRPLVGYRDEVRV